MGGELEKKTLEQNPNLAEIVKSEKKKSKNKNKKEITETVTTDTVKSNNVKRGGASKKKKDKMQVVAKDKPDKKVNYEKKVLELEILKNMEQEVLQNSKWEWC